MLLLNNKNDINSMKDLKEFITDDKNVNENKLEFPYYEGFYLSPSQTKSTSIYLINVTHYDHTKRSSFQTFEECKKVLMEFKAMQKFDFQYFIIEQDINKKSTIIWTIIGDKEYEILKPKK